MSFDYGKKKKKERKIIVSEIVEEDINATIMLFASAKGDKFGTSVFGEIKGNPINSIKMFDSFEKAKADYLEAAKIFNIDINEGKYEREFEWDCKKIEDQAKEALHDFKEKTEIDWLFIKEEEVVVSAEEYWGWNEPLNVKSFKLYFSKENVASGYKVEEYGPDPEKGVSEVEEYDPDPEEGVSYYKSSYFKSFDQAAYEFKSKYTEYGYSYKGSHLWETSVGNHWSTHFRENTSSWGEVEAAEKKILRKFEVEGLSLGYDKYTKFFYVSEKEKSPNYNKLLKDDPDPFKLYTKKYSYHDNFFKAFKEFKDKAEAKGVDTKDLLEKCLDMLPEDVTKEVLNALKDQNINKKEKSVTPELEKQKKTPVKDTKTSQKKYNDRYGR